MRVRLVLLAKHFGQMVGDDCVVRRLVMRPPLRCRF